MPDLQRLDAGHAAALLRFERENRAYFARSISDRGDAYFADFAARHAALLADQAAGQGHFHLLIDDDGETVLGRFNLVDVADGTAELGFRVAEQRAGRGVATAAVARVCDLPATPTACADSSPSAALDNPGSADGAPPQQLHPGRRDGPERPPGLRHIRDLSPTDSQP